MSKAWPRVALGEVLQLAERWEAPRAGSRYRQLGVRLRGQGAYERETIDGADTKYARLNRVQVGDFVVNKIWAREGSAAVVPSPLDGCFVSGEFPLFELSRALLPEWLACVTRTDVLTTQFDRDARGTSGKNRVTPEQILQATIPLPPIGE